MTKDQNMPKIEEDLSTIAAAIPKDEQGQWDFVVWDAWQRIVLAAHQPATQPFDVNSSAVQVFARSRKKLHVTDQQLSDLAASARAALSRDQEG